MLNVKARIVQGYKQMDIPFTILSKNNDSKNLSILLPGAGYTVQGPLLHYATGVYLNKSFDVLQINYRYNDKFYDDFSDDELSHAIRYDVNAVLDHVLKDKSYENYYVIAKSLGTIAVGSVLERDEVKNAKAIWMTPLIQREDVLNAMINSKNKGLCIIGDNDHFYTKERYVKIIENTNISSMLIPNANHSLEYTENAIESIDILRRVVEEIEHF